MALDRSILRSPVITEKATILRDSNTYTFRVDPRANKIQIRQAVEAIFEVKVESVRTVPVPRKKKRQGVAVGMTSKGKKAYVKLRAGDSIELVES
ncbi:MAG: 50S ribosomal protein L23 [Gemmatimonadetes bacterium]|jgi:large subunit ribosomal protein L23|nr:50S ribosomal protein L23 [Gemmatimonadota bacterium]MBT7351796.1 50S ribosomal protein L23 [Phycisphaerae bacterium]MBT4609597.1 50S ribosomal protein L23 [Gemmatimonadota bacterium]MBT5055661.1 50S ribosomal protein L23 [Gemmatimonadota bacterium]MBT5143824.1 50S ribosomal protein L23 [Gemmatimonadota bacterium]